MLCPPNISRFLTVKAIYILSEQGFTLKFRCLVVSLFTKLHKPPVSIGKETQAFSQLQLELPQSSSLEVCGLQIVMVSKY